jgi:hypothetical protein
MGASQLIRTDFDVIEEMATSFTDLSGTETKWNEKLYLS